MAFHAHKRLQSAGSSTTRVAAWAAAMAALLLAPRLARPQATELVGRIVGGDITAKGQVSTITNQGRTTTLLASGSKVSVRSGQARLELEEGGEIILCGPAHFTVLKSSGAITLALDFGRIHAVLAGAAPLTVYTPLIVATPVSVSGAPRDVTIGLEVSGALCVRTASGAVRLGEQLNGQSVVVPQFAEMALPSGQLDSVQPALGSCACEALVAKAAPPPTPKPPEFSVPAHASTVEKTASAVKTERPAAVEPAPAPAAALPEVSADKSTLPGPPATEVPTWKVVMPPLVFNANAPAPPPDPAPETILLIRGVRVTPEIFFSGRVQPRSAAHPTREKTRKILPGPKGKPQRTSVGLLGWLKGLFGGKPSPCLGVGCGDSH